MELSVEQKKAVNCNSSKLLVLAGAGSGKTQCIIQRLKRQILGGVRNTDILCLTFTRSAAYEMKQKYEKDSNLPCPKFTTFHAFCYSILVENKIILSKLGYTNIPDICDKTQEDKFKLEAKLKTNVSLSQSKLKNPDNLSYKDKRLYKVWNASYNNILKQHNKITFDLILDTITDLFISDDLSVDRYKKQYKYVYVDEFQDTDIRQWKFIQSMKDSNIYLTGDALQAIYSFRGATSKIIKEISKDPSFTKIKLSNNYRSDINIVNYANEVSDYADDSYRIVMNPIKIEFGSVIKHINTTKYVDYNCMSEFLNIPSGNKAILARTNRTASQIKNWAKNNKIDFYEDITSVKKKPHITNCIQCAISKDLFEEYIVSNLTQSEYTKYLTAYKYGIRFEEIFNQLNFSESTKQFISTVTTIQNILSTNNSYQIKLIDICKLFDIDYENNTVDFNCITEQICSITDILNRILSILDNNSNDLYIGTIHSVKGLEFPAVYISEVNCPTFLLNDEENKNLYYVAATRAQNVLYVEYHN